MGLGGGGLVDGGRAAAGDFVVMRYASFALVGGGWVRQRSGLKRGVWVVGGSEICICGTLCILFHLNRRTKVM